MTQSSILEPPAKREKCEILYERNLVADQRIVSSLALVEMVCDCCVRAEKLVHSACTRKTMAPPSDGGKERAAPPETGRVARPAEASTRQSRSRLATSIS